jgi:AcrR family transcriptional regulator
MSVKEKIVNAAIECIEQYGMAGTTIRKVARIAGVNSAAISYHFGGEKKMIDTALARTLQNAFSLSDFEAFEDAELKTYLTAVFGFLIRGAFRFPNISKAHLYDVYIGGEDNAPVSVALSGFLEELLAKIRPKTDLEEAVLRRRLFTLMAQVVYFIVSPRLLTGFAPDTAVAENAEKAAEDLVEALF